MKLKFHYVITLLILGLFFMPTEAVACGTKTAKACCQKEVTSKETKKDCCSSNAKDKKHKGCQGKCGNSNCTSSSAQYSFLSNVAIELQPQVLYFSFEKPNLYYEETFRSSNFSSIWQPPKIG